MTISSLSSSSTVRTTFPECRGLQLYCRMSKPSDQNTVTMHQHDPSRFNMSLVLRTENELSHEATANKRQYLRGNFKNSHIAVLIIHEEVKLAILRQDAHHSAMGKLQLLA